MQQFLLHYGYVLVFLAAMVEGESVILTASVLASQGHLDITKVAFVAFLGTLIADQGLYFVGRVFGRKLFARYPLLKQKGKIVFNFLEHYSTTFILSFRFIYGIRTLSPIVIGMSSVRPRQYMILNFIAAVIWTVLSCAAGFYLGDVVFQSLASLDPLLKWMIVVLLGGLLLEGMHRASKKIAAYN